MACWELNNLSIERNGKAICNKLQLTIEPGQIWTILGRNGAGKSSLLHSIAGLLPYKQGRIQLFKKDLKNYRGKARAQQLGVLLQQAEAQLASEVEHIVSNARFPYRRYFQNKRSDDQAIVASALKTMDLLSLQHRSSDQLSGGERQRLAIASLLAQQPEIYLLDEPSNHLDLHYQIRLLQHLQTLAKKGKTIIMVLQDLNLASRFSSHALLLFGDGNSLAGEKKSVLQKNTLEKLYQQDLQCVDTTLGPLWFAK